MERHWLEAVRVKGELLKESVPEGLATEAQQETVPPKRVGGQWLVMEERWGMVPPMRVERQ